MKALTVFHDGYVKIEYQHNGTRTRKSTGVALEDKRLLRANGTLSTKVPDYEIKQKAIESYSTRANSIIIDHFHKYRTQPTGEQFKRAWNEYNNKIKDSKRLLDYYAKFYETKQTEFSRDGYNEKSIKDYTNIRYYLEDYETNTNTVIVLEDINRDWLNKFVVFLETERDEYDFSRKQGGKYWSKGGLVGETIKKRIGLLIGFFRWIADEGYFDFPKGISTFYKTLDGSEAVKAVLTQQEVNNLYNHDFNDEKLNYIKDVFVLSCFTGMRWEDIYTMHKRHVFMHFNVGDIIEKMAIKTKEVFRVPLNPISKAILEKYDYTFNRYGNANFNKYLKILLKQSGWFNDDTNFPKDETTYLKRWECISIHRGRDTFCTMLVNNRVPINEIMKYTGHKSISSLNKYIDTKSQVLNFTNELVLP